MIEWLDVPGQTGLVANGVGPDGTIVGVVQEASGRVRGLVLPPNRLRRRLVDAPAAEDTFLQGITAGGVIIGDATRAGRSRAFLLLGGMFSALEPPGSVDSWAGGVRANGDACGSLIDEAGVRAGFRRLAGRWERVLPAGADSAVIHGMGEGGEVVGACDLGGNAAGFMLREAGTIEWLEYPDGVFVPRGCARSGAWVVGEVVDAQGAPHASECRNGVWRQLELPDGPWRESAAMSVQPGVGIVGWAMGDDGVKRGFLLRGGA